MLKVETIQGRPISQQDLAQIQALRRAHPLWSRSRLSRALAQSWQWYAASGQLKDMAARSLLLKLQERGLITLPPRCREPIRRPPPPVADASVPPPRAPLGATLAQLRPLQIQVLRPRQPDYLRFQHYLVQYHYLGFRGPVGESLAYLVKSRAGVDLACLLFGAAAWQCAPRDRWIGWSALQRQQHLAEVVNNSRFLILPWARTPGLATYLLAQMARRIQADWQQRYHHPIYWLETFVQSDRFRGTCYQAANWIRVGQTTGRTRQSTRHRDNAVHAPVKDIYLYPLQTDGRRTHSR